MKKTEGRIEGLVAMVKKLGLVPMFTHFKVRATEDQRRIVATACDLVDSDYNTVARGLSVVSVNDNPVKSQGRYISLRRAFRALMTQEKRVMELTKTMRQMVPTYGDIGAVYKGIYKPSRDQLSYVEVSRLDKRKLFSQCAK